MIVNYLVPLALLAAWPHHVRIPIAARYHLQACSNTSKLAPPDLIRVKDRLAHLEQAILAQIQDTAPSSSNRQSTDISMDPGNPGSGSPPHSDGGNLRFGPSESQYVSGTHWAAIFKDIADLKGILKQEEDGEVDTPHTPHTLLLHGCKPVSKKDILGALPLRPVADTLISQYFNRLDLAPSK